MVIEFDPYEPAVLYVGRSGDGKLDRSSDGAVTWEYAGYINGGGITSLEFGRNSNEMYISSWWSFAYPVGIFKTTDRGINWNNIGQGFEGGGNVYDVGVNFITTENIYIGLEAGADTNGMYVKKNDQPWEHFGLTDMIVRSIAIDNNLIYAATDSGLFVRNILSSVEPEINNHSEIDYLLYPAYPNPFNSTTNIKYSIPHSGRITLKVFDILGREVTTLIDEEKSAGIYEDEFNAGNLSSGVYFYSITAGNFHQTKKMILLR